MKVVVMGAGVIGVTTACYLARQGAEVVVLDRQPGPGMETSYANAGELSYGMTSPWAAPGIPMKALKWLFMKRRPLRDLTAGWRGRAAARGPGPGDTHAP